MNSSPDFSAISGIVFLDKPHGWTSRRAVNEVVRLYSALAGRRIKAGHAGTLDPMATGMLPVLVGEATRFADVGLNAEKAYETTLDLSRQTDTLDLEGEETGHFDTPVGQQAVESMLEQFRGKQLQVPPAYSAIRIDGKRAHALARRGESVELKPREIEILDLQLLEYRWPLVSLAVRCSKGTYIRSLARDIGDALGVGGCVTVLRRTSTGGWPAEMMVTPEQLASEPGSCLIPLSQWLRELPRVELPVEEAKRFVQGQRIQQDGIRPGEAAIFSDGRLLGTAEIRQGMVRMVLHPLRILPSAQQYFREYA